jgi:hypothetical protein
VRGFYVVKLSDIPLTVSTLPLIGHKEAAQAQRLLCERYGVVSTIWKVGDEWVLEVDDYKWIGRRFMMVRLCSAHQIAGMLAALG